MSTITEKIKQIKAFFMDEMPGEPTTVEAPAPVYKLADGSEVTIDRLEIGGTVHLNGEPAPEGELTLEDGTKITVGVNGVITALTLPATADTVVPAPDPVEEMNRRFSEELQSIRTELGTHRQEFSSLQTAFGEAKQTIGRQQETISQLLQVVEQLAAVPTAPPAEPARNTFQRQGAEREAQKDERIKKYAAALKTLREN